MRTIATFRSPRFPPPSDGLAAATDPLVTWVVAELHRTPYWRVHDAEDEDWGAFVTVESAGADYRLNFALDDGPPPGWMLEVQRPKRSLKHRDKHQDSVEHGRLVQSLHAVLRSDPSITALLWHVGSAFGSGDRSTGAEAPD